MALPYFLLWCTISYIKFSGKVGFASAAAGFVVVVCNVAACRQTISMNTSGQIKMFAPLEGQ